MKTVLVCLHSTIVRLNLDARVFRLAIAVGVLVISSVGLVSRAGGQGQTLKPRPVSYPGPPVSGAFAPSNARTQDGALIPASQFPASTRCGGCHTDTHAAWSQSLHRNAAREPFYRESVDILLHTRGIEATRHCESCHTPVALFSGALTKDSPRQEAPFTALDDEGVTCTVCHSITEARLDGTGSFTIRRPALLAREDGTPIYGDVSDEQILGDVPAHKRAVMRPLLRTPEFCSTCHKVDAPPELNAYKHIRGFSAYDEWQQSGASHESALPFYLRESRTDCRGCHMPKIESLNDRAAKNGMIASHRWPGANTAAPLFYGQKEQAALTETFLSANVLIADIMLLKNETTGDAIDVAQAASLRGLQLAQALSSPGATQAASFRGSQSVQSLSSADATQTNSLRYRPGDTVTADVVIANRNAAHSFPPEVRDLYEAWVEFEAVDATGHTVFHSGYLQPDGMLDPGAHVYRTLILDEQGRTITRHQIWLTNIKAYDNAIPAGRSDLARFRFQIPQPDSPTAGTDATGASLTLRVRVKYRRLNQEYFAYVTGRRNAEFDQPVITMAGAEVSIAPKSGDRQNRSDGPCGPCPAEARRWNDYGIALLEQVQYGAAAAAFRRAMQLDPTDASLPVNAAIAEMRTERFGLEREQLHKAGPLLEAALRLDPQSPRAHFYHALWLRAEGKLKEASGELCAVTRDYPRDREAQRQLAMTLYSLGEMAGARSAFEAVLAVDPTDAGAYQFLAPIYMSEGRKEDADRARLLYLQWRDDPLADGIAARFYTAHPEWAEERIPAHVHGAASARRPVLSGVYASPDK
jgi:Tfp pilus assembly protein PilF